MARPPLSPPRDTATRYEAMRLIGFNSRISVIRYSEMGYFPILEGPDTRRVPIRPLLRAPALTWKRFARATGLTVPRVRELVAEGEVNPQYPWEGSQPHFRLADVLPVHERFWRPGAPGCKRMLEPHRRRILWLRKWGHLGK
ncbi:MAG: hypothetical protein L0216_08445 [Planctomycetales bacterium]|nr:hypothetical protein [Planctomycetales bacterium]